MFTVNRRHYGDDWRQHQEAAVALVGLHDKVFAFAQPGGCARLIHSPAHDKGRVEMGCRQYGGDHRSCRRLAVRAGHSNSIFQPHQFRKHLRARNHRNFAFVRFDDFGIVRFYRGRSHDDVRTIRVRSLVTLENGRAEILQAFGDRRRFYVGTRYGIAKREQHFSNAAHADAADTDQVNALKITKRNHHEPALCRISCTFAASSIKLTMSRAA